MIRAIIFDLGGVILPFDFSHAYERMERLSGLARDEIRRRLVESKLPARLESGRIQPQAFVDSVNQLLGTRLGFEEFRDVWVSIFAEDPLIPENLLSCLKDRYRLLLLSNTNAIHFDWVVENFPHFAHFDRWVVSHEVGALKPDPAIYAEVLRHTGCRAEECFFTDDVPAYVDGARKAGIDAVQFTGLEGLRAQMAARNISIGTPAGQP